MRHRLFATVLTLGFLISVSAHADDYIYKSRNKIDFIKLEKAKKDEKEGGLKHPTEFTDDQLRSILQSIKFNKKIIMIKDIENRDLFAADNVEFLLPYLKEAFQKAKDDQVVIASYFTRDTKLVIQNDRLTIFRAFVKDDGLHIKFTKLYAKLLGDRVTQGSNVATSQARGMRVSLELQPGQNRISWDPEELVFDLNQFSASGGSAAVAKEEKPSKDKKEVVRKTKTAKSSEQTSDVTDKAQNMRDRLKELDQLKKDGVISDKEYQSKRRDILKDF